MKRVLEEVEAAKVDFAEHPFWSRMRRPWSAADIRKFVPEIGFWVLGFVDVLRYLEDLTQDEQFKAILAENRIEDKRHYKWYLADLKALEIELSAAEVFAESRDAIRDVVYELVGRVMSSEFDAERMALAMAVEAAGRVAVEFFAVGISDYGGRRPLIYFGPGHLKVETESDEHMQALLTERALSPDEREAACLAVRDTFCTFHRMMDYFERFSAEGELGPIEVSAPIAARPLHPALN